MLRLIRWSNPFAPCHRAETFGGRLQWRPSGLLVAALLVLGLLAAASILLSDAQPLLAWPGALCAAAWGAVLARREAARNPIEIVIEPNPARGSMPTALVDGQRCNVLRLRWRGPIAFLDLDVGGAVRRLVFGPDVLSAAARRELRLRVPRGGAASARPSMAP